MIISSLVRKSTLCLLLALTVLLGLPSAQAQKNLTVTVAPVIFGINIVNQLTGAVTVCAYYSNSGGVSPVIRCGQIATVTPLGNPPEAKVGISVYPALWTSSNTYNYGEPIPEAMFWLVNNSTGGVQLCAGNGISQGSIWGGCGPVVIVQ
jgi:hypothetical protein